MFDQVVVIGLRSRPNRLERFWNELPSSWPFREPIFVPAIDGKRCQSPDWYRQTRTQDRGLLHRPRVRGAPNLSGAWGCLRSHHRVWEDALNNDLQSVLVFEDDAIFRRSFTTDVAAFLDTVPDDWDQLYFGGQHLGVDGLWPVRVNEQVLRGRYVNRTHAYAVRRPMLDYLYAHFMEPWASENPSLLHLDHHLCQVHREWDRQAERHVWNIYCPLRWLAGQAEGISDVKIDKPQREHWWDDFQICEPKSQEQVSFAPV